MKFLIPPPLVRPPPPDLSYINRSYRSVRRREDRDDNLRNFWPSTLTTRMRIQRRIQMRRIQRRGRKARRMYVKRGEM
ncbi:hypothetical protein DAI22_11g153800 [Oryza sativa Japonica Group]|nr:hypothetical protein DAI22_11g153800 [Oryza sativa Japonica Group]